jgi:hypothetical protein
MSSHCLQEISHRNKQLERIIQYWRPDFSKAFDQDFLPRDAGFLLRHMPDAHLGFCFACPHSVSL